MNLSHAIFLSSFSFCLAWVLPGHYSPWTAFRQEFFAAASGILICFVVLRSGRTCLVWPRAFIFSILLLFVPLLQYSLDLIRFSADAVLSSVYIAAFGVATFSGTNLTESLHRESFLHGLTSALVAAALLSCGMALYQWLGLPSVEWIEPARSTGRLYANLAQPNHLSTLLIFGVLGLIYWFETGKLTAGTAAVGIGLLMWSIVLTGSRTGILVVIFLGLVGIGLAFKRMVRARSYAFFIGLGIFAVMILLRPALESAGNEADIRPAVRSEVGVRPRHWAVLLEAVWRGPWYGYGWNQVPQAYVEWALNHPAANEVVLHSHNLMIDLMIYLGLIPGLVIFLAMVIWFIRRVLAARKPEHFFLLSCLFAVFVHACLELPLHYLYFLIPAGLMVGSLSGMPELSREPTLRAGWLVSAIPALVLSVAYAFVTVDYIRTEEAFRQLRFANARIGMTRADLQPVDLWVLDHFQAYYDAGRIDIDENLTDAQKTLLGDVARRFPFSPMLYRHASALAIDGRNEEASRVLALICKLYPVHVEQAVREEWEKMSVRFPSVQAGLFKDCVD